MMIVVLLSNRMQKVRAVPLFSNRWLHMLRYMYALSPYQTSPTRGGICMPVSVPNFTYTMRYMYALSPYQTSPTRWGICMPCLRTKLHLRVHGEVYLYPSSYQIHLYREVYLCPVSVPNFTYTVKYIYALSPYQTPPKLHLPAYRFPLHSALIQSDTVHALPCLQVVFLHPAGMSRNQFQYFPKICYPCIIWGI
jgi:hypothetical protein